MSLLSKLFGGGSGGGGGTSSKAEPEVYHDYAIFVEPMKEGSRYRIAARIEKEIGGEVKTHQLIRADTLDSLDAAAEATLRKAKAVIDEQGDRIFS